MVVGIAIVVIGGLALLFGLLLGYAAGYFKIEGDPFVEQIEMLLPQSQCGKCGYPGCHPYAQAIANQEADINLCLPGGEITRHTLAELLNQDPNALSAEKPLEEIKILAVIEESQCIGCTLCIQACPVDAILGASRQMHTVLAQECTGCELCVAPCPVNCIQMVSVQPTLTTWKWPYPVVSLPVKPPQLFKSEEVELLL
ncbi:electron transport complex, RnfABCDGE type, B subunit [Thioploca ingrica]|uniref:Ion-translocating oxidoreductase complex subunit B n=1 Tax=Thioploca ingrica TaxID=40754 RepID=A0A090BV94_9GAMM|nr:electron transport complex, RnfABCDGE type, B subunit [Thioploca ingrica]